MYGPPPTRNVGARRRDQHLRRPDARRRRRDRSRRGRGRGGGGAAAGGVGAARRRAAGGGCVLGGGRLRRRRRRWRLRRHEHGARHRRRPRRRDERRARPGRGCGGLSTLPGWPGGRRRRRARPARPPVRAAPPAAARDERRRPADAEVLLRPDVDRPQIRFGDLVRPHDVRRQQHHDVGLVDLVSSLLENSCFSTGTWIAPGKPGQRLALVLSAAGPASRFDSPSRSRSRVVDLALPNDGHVRRRRR